MRPPPATTPVGDQETQGDVSPTPPSAGGHSPQAEHPLVCPCQCPTTRCRSGSHDPRSLKNAWKPSPSSNSCNSLSARASPVAQTVKNLSAMQYTQVQSLGWEEALEKGMATHSSILAWRIPWTGNSMGSQRVTTKRSRKPQPVSEFPSSVRLVSPCRTRSV